MKNSVIIFLLYLALIKSLAFADGPLIKKEEIPIIPMPPYIEQKDKLPFFISPEKPKEPTIINEREENPKSQ